MDLPKLALLPLLAGLAMPLQAQVLNYIGGPVTKLDETAPPRPANFDNVSERYFDWLYGLSSGNKVRKEVLALETLNGRSVFKMTVKNSDPLEYGGKRTEVTPSRERVREGRRWYAGSVFFPGESVDDKGWSLSKDDGWIVVFQIHSSQGIVATSPPFSIVANGKELLMEGRSNLIGEYTLRNDGTISTSATPDNTAKQRVRLGQIQRNQWYCFVVDADWQHEPGKGAFRVWMNGELVYEAQNLSTHYRNVDLQGAGNYPKTGIYLSAFGNPELNDRRVLYTDFIHIGGTDSTYEQLAAKTPCGVNSQPARGVAY